MQGVYTGSFDPLTLGHKDIVERALKMCDKLYIAVSDNINKKHLFSKDERVEMIKETFKGNEKIVVESFQGLLVDYVLSKKASFIIRGLRAVSDFEYEFQMAFANRNIESSIETVFMVPSSQYLFLSSTIVRDIARNNGDISKLVPEKVMENFQKFVKK